MIFLRYILCLVLIVLSFDIYSQNNEELKTVVAKKGDGIYKMLRDNGYPAKEYYNAFLELNKDKITKDDCLIQGESYFLPPLQIAENLSESKDSLIVDTVVSLKDSISELQFADEVIDDKLKGSIIYLISGHGGPDPGAVAVVDGHKISEDEYAYDICMRIARNIEKHGGVVYMIVGDPDDSIRDEKFLKIDYDEYCYPDLEIPRNHTERLKQRADAVNKLYNQNKDVKYQRVVEIHLDSRSNGTKLDVFFYHYEKSKSGKKFAENIQKVFASKYAKHQPNRGYNGTVSARNLYIIRRVMPVAVFIELGNIQNQRDQRRFLDYNNRQALANWITEGIIEDYIEK